MSFLVAAAAAVVLSVNEDKMSAMEADTPTLILRFRDLVVSKAGHTVEQHNKCVEEHGYVWWGWWRKQHEEIPRELWDVLNQAAEDDDPVPVLLVDSGQRKLFRSRLSKVEFTMADETPAPEEGQRTPDYYLDSQQQGRFASWFKLVGEIEEIDVKEINNFVYERVPHDDVVTGTPRQLLGRRIPHLQHLLSFGNVTYWVANPAPEEAYDAAPVSALLPSAIDRQFTMRAENNLVLHLTDLHLGSHHAWEVSPQDVSQTSLADAVESSLAGVRPSVVLVTGDLTWCGSKEEFANATKCLDDLRSRLGLRKTDFIIVPGNHDAGWIREVDAANQWDGKYRIESNGGLQNYKEFFENWYQSDADPHYSIGRRVFFVGGDSVDFIGLNSASLQQVEGTFAGVGYVPRGVFQDAIRRMEWKNTTRATHVRVLLLHHHLLPVTGEESLASAAAGFGITSNAAELLRMAADVGVDLVIHGHQHQPYAGTWSEVPMSGPSRSRTVNVLGGGSCGVVDSDLGPIRQRTFSLIRFERGRINVEILESHESKREFTKLKSIYADAGSGWVSL